MKKKSIALLSAFKLKRVLTFASILFLCFILLASIQFTPVSTSTCKATVPLESNVVQETFSMQPEYQMVEAAAEQSLILNLPASQEGSTNYATMTQDVLFGFTYAFSANPVLDTYGDLGHGYVGVRVDIALGLRLPVRITLEYPQQMTYGHDYTVYATLTPLDWSASQYSSAGLTGLKADEHEFLARFVTQAYAYVNILGRTLLDESYGPSIDFSRNFATPFGSTSFPISTQRFNIIDNSVLTLSLELEPDLGSTKITAAVSEEAARSGTSMIEWSDSGQRIPLTIHTSDYNPNTKQVKVELSDFKYYFNKFYLNGILKYDFHGDLVNWLDSQRTVFTADLSWLTEKLYLNVHEGTSGIANIYMPTSLAIFGNAAMGSVFDTNDANAQSVSYFTSTTTGSITDIRAYVCGASSGKVIAALYAVSGGSAGALLAQSNAVSIGISFSWVDFQLPTPYTVTAGTTYGLAIMGDVPVYLWIVRGSGQRTGGPGYGSYAKGFTNPFGTVWFNDPAGAMSIYASSN